jgi:hypothetical protein
MLNTLNRILKRTIPESARNAIVKFYLLNSPDRYAREISSGQMRDLITVWELIINHQGWLRSRLASECLDAQAKPIPWYTYPAIEYLSKIDWTGLSIFEFGSGNSSLWWAERAKTVTSVEFNLQWFERVRARLPQNAKVLYKPDPQDYIHSLQAGYDVIVIDGLTHNYGRLRCAEQAIAAVPPHGLIILDNADCLPRSTNLLRSQGLLEIDFAGIYPLNTEAGVTSLFFGPEWKPIFISPNHPSPAVGGKIQNWEDPQHEYQTDRIDLHVAHT